MDGYSVHTWKTESIFVLIKNPGLFLIIEIDFILVFSILESLSLESEVGDANKQVLKNVSKIENFITEQLKLLSDDILVFPSFYTIPI